MREAKMKNKSIISKIADKTGGKTHIFMFSLSSIMTVVVVIFFISAFAGKACGNPTIDTKKRISDCNVSILLSSIFESENKKRSILFFERGILHSILRENDDAVQDFVTSIKFASTAKTNDEAVRRISRFMIEIESKRNEPNVMNNWDAALSRLTTK